MPRVKPLGSAQKQAEIIKKQNQTFAEVLQLYMIRNEKRQDEVADKIGCTAKTLGQRKVNPGRSSFEDVRETMHKLGATPEQWAQLGGFS